MLSFIPNVLKSLTTFIAVHGGFVHKVTIDIIGDPMLDLWQTSDTWMATPGGAFNTYSNMEKLTKNLNHIELRSVFYPLKLDSQNTPLQEAIFCGYPYKIYECDKNWKINLVKDPPKSKYMHCLDCKVNNLEAVKNFSILVVSDYNKGFVYKNLESLLDRRFYNICIVDSRYATTNFALLKKRSDCLIYRVTRDSDIETHFDWDYKILSNGINPTRLFDKYSSITIPIENIKEAKCSIGCGDTFTATIAAFLALKASVKEYWGQFVYDRYVSNYFPTWNDIIEGITLSHKACQDVVSRPLTAITNINLI